MNLTRMIEIAAANYIASKTGLIVRKTEDSHKPQEPMMALALASESRGIPGLPGCESVKLTVELRTVLNLFPASATAVSRHYAHFDDIRDAMMMDDLATALPAAGPGWGVNGIDMEADYRHDNQNGTLVNAITRTLHSVPMTLS